MVCQPIALHDAGRDTPSRAACLGGAGGAVGPHGFNRRTAAGYQARIPILDPQAGDYDIVKHRVSPFYATSLEAILGANGIGRIYISGVSTSGAVLSAAKEGHDRDYEVVVLEDCCCALTEEQHQSVIEQMQRIAVVTTSKDVQFE